MLQRIRRAIDHFEEELRLGVHAGGQGVRLKLHLTATQIRALLSLAETGSFSAAAKALGLSDPTVHRAVRELEQSCNIVITERRGRRVGLSEAGRRMSRGFALGVDELNVALQETAQQPDRVSIGAMALSRCMLVPVTLAELSQIAPYAEIDVVDGSYGELVEALRRGTVELVIGTLREPAPADLAQELLMYDRLTVVGRSDHPLAGKSPSLKELAVYPWVVGRRTSALLERWQQIFSEAGIPCPRAPIQCDSVTTIRGILIRSNFLTLLSRDQVTAELEAGSLTPIRSAIPDIMRTIGVITRRDWFPTALQQQFLDLLRHAAASMAPETRVRATS